MDDAELLQSIMTTILQLHRVPEQELGRIWGDAIQVQERSDDSALWAATDQLLNAIDAEFVSLYQRGHKERLENSPLGLVGYLGEPNARQPAARRQSLLSGLYRRTIPPVFPQEDLFAWGEPATDQRLRHLADTICGLIRLPERRGTVSSPEMVSDWREDLAYLHHRHHRGNFPWPAS